MFRTTPRFIARQAGRPAGRPRAPPAPTRRFQSTATPPAQKRSWKSLGARLGLAGAVVYWYNTNEMFEEDAGKLAPVHALSSTARTDADALPTLESIAAERAQRRAVQRHLELQREKEAAAEEAHPELSAANEAQEIGSAEDAAPQGGIEGLQAEADQQGAFNPETGEINWDCPCLGGMATGPCGDEFKAAFSCFVYSAEEPKGMDCIDKFKDMQNCFRQYPEIYGGEIDNDDDDDMTADAAADMSTEEPAKKESTPVAATKEPAKKESTPAASGPHSPAKLDHNRRELGLVPENYRTAEHEIKRDEPTSESATLVPKAAHDDR